MGLLTRQFIIIHLVPYSKTKSNYPIIPKNLRKDERGSFIPTIADVHLCPASRWSLRMQGRSEPCLPSGGSQSSRAIEQREAGAGVRGCRHLASPPPIWRARSMPGNWKTKRWYPSGLCERARAPALTHTCTGRDWWRWRLKSGFEVVFSV